MVDDVDEDQSGQIEFGEFLSIISNTEGSTQTQQITKFFKDLTTGQYDNKNISFSLFVLKVRRQHLMDAIKGDHGSDAHEKGVKIMANLKVQWEREK